MIKSVKICFSFFFLFILILTACSGDDGVIPTSAPTAISPPVNNDELPPTNVIETPIFESTDVVATTPTASEIEAGSVITGDDFLPIDEILNEIDNDVCQDAYETKAELEALIEAGEDLGELETAVEELIQELENCPTPTPAP